MGIGRYSILIIAFECHYSHVDRFIKYLKQVNPFVAITLFADDHAITDGISNNVDEIIRYRYSIKNLSISSRELDLQNSLYEEYEYF